MPTKAQLRRRGGAVKVRTIKVGRKRYARVYVVRKAGKRGGHTMLSEIKGRRRSPKRRRK